jgi:hypothetical protein
MVRVVSLRSMMMYFFGKGGVRHRVILRGFGGATISGWGMIYGR